MHVVSVLMRGAGTTPGAEIPPGLFAGNWIHPEQIPAQAQAACEATVFFSSSVVNDSTSIGHTSMQIPH